MKKKLHISLIALLFSFTLSAVDIYVSPTKGNDANNGSLASQLKTVETAVFGVKDNIQTTIHIESNSIITLGAILNFGQNKKVAIVGKNVTIKAAALAAQKDPSGLPLLGQGNRIIQALDNCDLKVTGITFQNARQVGYLPGGAIYFTGNTLVVDSCKFIDNQAGSCGGAIGARAKSVIVTNSYFQGNNILGGGARGAAIMQAGPATGTTRGTLSVQNSTFYNNTTQTDGYGYVINIYDSSLGNEGGKYSNTGKLEVTNCTFLQNSSVTHYMAAIDVSDGDCEAYIVNNTFYNNSESAFRLLMNKAYLANNVIVGGKQGILSDYKVADGRPEMVAVNNIVVGSEGGINAGIDDACFKSAAVLNNNIINTTAAYPLGAVSLASSLSTDNFVPYLAITSANSTLVDAGTENTLALFAANYVLPVDIRGRLTNNKKDIGAFEYNGILPVPSGINSPEYISDNYRISQNGNTFSVKNISDKSFRLDIINMTGRIVYSAQVRNSLEVSKKTVGQGVFVLVLNDGSKISSKKIIF